MRNVKLSAFEHLQIFFAMLFKVFMNFNTMDIFGISRRIYNKNETFRSFQVSSGLKMKIWLKQSFFVLMIVNLNSKTLHEKYLLLLCFEGVIVSVVTHWKPWSHEMNFVYVNFVKALRCFSRKRFSIFLEIPVEDSLARSMNRNSSDVKLENKILWVTQL